MKKKKKNQFIKLPKPKAKFESEARSQILAKNIKANTRCSPNNLLSFLYNNARDITVR